MSAEDAAILMFSGKEQAKPKPTPRAGGKFKPGQSGNPAGKPKGSRDKRTAFRAAIAEHADEIINSVIEQALSGDIQAQKMCLDRIVSTLRPESLPITISLPRGSVSTSKGLIAASASIIRATATGKLSATDAQALSALLEGQRKMIELTDIVERLECLEAQR